MVEKFAVSLTIHSLHGFKKLPHKEIKQKSKAKASPLTTSLRNFQGTNH